MNLDSKVTRRLVKSKSKDEDGLFRIFLNTYYSSAWRIKEILERKIGHPIKYLGTFMDLACFADDRPISVELDFDDDDQVVGARNPNCTDI